MRRLITHLQTAAVVAVLCCAYPHVKLPAHALDGHDDKEDHDQEGGGKDEEAAGANADWLAGDEVLDEPGQGEADVDVKDVGADGGGDSHVAKAVAGNNDTADGVGDAGSTRQDGEAHDGVGDAESEAKDRSPPDHAVGKGGDPDEGHEERDDEELGQLLLLAVGDGEEHEQVQWQGQGPEQLARLRFGNVEQALIGIQVLVRLDGSHLPSSDNVHICRALGCATGLLVPRLAAW